MKHQTADQANKHHRSQERLVSHESDTPAGADATFWSVESHRYDAPKLDNLAKVKKVADCHWLIQVEYLIEVLFCQWKLGAKSFTDVVRINHYWKLLYISIGFPFELD